MILPGSSYCQAADSQDCDEDHINILWLREDLNEEKKRFLSAIAPIPQPPPPLTPIRATWSFFSDVKIQDLKVT